MALPREIEQAIQQLTRLETSIQQRALLVWKPFRTTLRTLLSDEVGLLTIQHASQLAARQVTQATAGAPTHISQLAQAMVEAQVDQQLLPPTPPSTLPLEAWEAAATATVLAEYVPLQGVQAPLALLLARLITGRDGRASALDHCDGALQLAVQRSIWGTFNSTVLSLGQQTPYQKQVVAARDERTTTCCTRAHGQVQPLDQPFVLTGTPRYADTMMAPPFHYHCRSVLVLHTPAMAAAIPI